MCIQNLERAKHEKSLLNILGKLPQDLAKLYALAYQQIIESPPKDREVANNVFKWLLCSQRLMTDQELIAAVAMDSDGTSFPLTHAELLSICCNFVIFNKEYRAFRFAHLSVREYFEGQAEFAESRINSYAVGRCVLIYSHVPEPNFQDALETYANAYWISHYARSGNSLYEGELAALFHRFLTNHLDRWVPRREQGKGLEHLWAENFYETGRDSRLQTRSPSVMPGLACIPSSLMSIACILKDLRILNLAIKLYGKTSTQRQHYMDEINESNRYGHFLLHYAVGHTDLAFSGLTLGDSSAGISASNKTILGLETITDEVDATFVRALTDRGADMNVCDTDCRTPLHWAALGNYESVLSLLVDKGASVHAVTKSYSTALHYAARAGSVAMVQKLLDAGADVDSVDLALKTPLTWAREAKQSHIVDFFVSRGARCQIDDRIMAPFDSRTPTAMTSSDSAMNAEAVLDAPEISLNLPFIGPSQALEYSKALGDIFQFMAINDFC